MKHGVRAILFRMPDILKAEWIARGIKKEREESVIKLILGCLWMDTYQGKFFTKSIKTMDGDRQMSWVRDKDFMPTSKEVSNI